MPTEDLALLPTDPATPDVAVTEALARWFDLALPEFVSTAGGGWRVVPGEHLVDVLPEPARWFGAGGPLQVLLGLHGRSVVVGAPVEFPGGMAGSPSLEVAEDPLAVSVAFDGWRDDLGAAIDHVLVQARREWGWCQACRAYLPVSEVTGVGGRFCVACQERYLMIIGC